MELDLLIKTLEVTTVSGFEDNMIDYISSFGIKHGIPVIHDVYGNVYLKKGSLEDGESYPCVVAHMDTVHGKQLKSAMSGETISVQQVQLNDKESLIGLIKKKNTHEIVGVGGDDKAGVAICLDLILKTDKIIGAFFKEEEIGCRGSFNLDRDVLKDVGYFIQFDAPTNNWCSYVSNETQLFNKEFYQEIKGVLNKYNITRVNDDDPFTDVFAIRKQLPVNCVNLFAGYYNQHTPSECVVINEVNKACDVGLELLQRLGNNKYEFPLTDEITPLKEILNV